MTNPTKDPQQFVETSVDDETVVMALDSGNFFSLSGTARDIWERLDGTRDRASLIAELAGEYGVPEAQVARDLDAFLAELGEAGLLRQK